MAVGRPRREVIFGMPCFIGQLPNKVRDLVHPQEDTVKYKAERGRFELPLPLRADRFSKPAHSTTLPPLRKRTLEVIASGGDGSIKQAVPINVLKWMGCCADAG